MLVWLPSPILPLQLRLREALLLPILASSPYIALDLPNPPPVPLFPFLIARLTASPGSLLW